MSKMVFHPSSLLIEINLDTPDPALFAAICAEARTAGVERFSSSPTWLCFGADELCRNDVSPAEYAEFRAHWTGVMAALSATTAAATAGGDFRPKSAASVPLMVMDKTLRTLIESLDADVLDVSAMSDSEVHAEWTAAGGTDADLERMLAIVSELLAKRRAAWRARGGRP